jgi:hypothetical protein
VAVERDGHAGVAEEGREGLGRGRRVARTDPPHALLSPHSDIVWRELWSGRV